MRKCISCIFFSFFMGIFPEIYISLTLLLLPVRACSLPWPWPHIVGNSEQILGWKLLLFIQCLYTDLLMIIADFVFIVAYYVSCYCVSFIFSGYGNTGLNTWHITRCSSQSPLRPWSRALQQWWNRKVINEI